MKISDLITKLQKELDTFGDVDVKCRDMVMGIGPNDICSVGTYTKICVDGVPVSIQPETHIEF